MSTPQFFQFLFNYGVVRLNGGLYGIILWYLLHYWPLDLTSRFIQHLILLPPGLKLLQHKG